MEYEDEEKECEDEEKECEDERECENAKKEAGRRAESGVAEQMEVERDVEEEEEEVAVAKDGESDDEGPARWRGGGTSTGSCPSAGRSLLPETCSSSKRLTPTSVPHGGTRVPRPRPTASRLGGRTLGRPSFVPSLRKTMMASSDEHVWAPVNASASASDRRARQYWAASRSSCLPTSLACGISGGRWRRRVDDGAAPASRSHGATDTRRRRQFSSKRRRHKRRQEGRGRVTESEHGRYAQRRRVLRSEPFGNAPGDHQRLRRRSWRLLRPSWLLLLPMGSAFAGEKEGDTSVGR